MVTTRFVDVCSVNEVKVDSSAAHAFFHRRGVGRMKHIDLRILRLQDLITAGGVKFKKIPRTQNLADMLTHSPSAKELLEHKQGRNLPESDTDTLRSHPAGLES